MQPNVIVAESIGHRARFAWLGVALAATIALLAVSQLSRAERERDADARSRAALVGRSLRVHQCGQHRWRARVEAERAERRARIEAERRAREEADSAEERARRDAARAERRALRAAERAAREAERAAREAERAGDWY
jgi:hypothetical protein